MSVWAVTVAWAITLLLWGWGLTRITVVRLSDHEVAAKDSNQAIRDYTFKKVNGWDLDWILLTDAIPFSLALAIASCVTLSLAGVF